MTEPTRPQPVVKAARLQGLISGLVLAIGGIMFTVRAGITADNLASLATLAGTACSLLAGLCLYGHAVITGKDAATEVTPLEEPQNDAGEQLLTAEQWARQAAQAGRHSEFHAAPVERPAYQRLTAPPPDGR